MEPSETEPKIALALGSGSARGWAHIGVIKALRRHGVEPDIITGTSVGAIVGAIHALDALAPFERWLLKLNRGDIFAHMDIRLSGGGFVRGNRLLETFRSHFGEPRFSDLKLPFAAVATDLETGHEVWLQEGPVGEAIRASISLPGLFAPMHYQGRWLVDGGLVNPVPVSLARALGAQRVIAVSLNEGLVGRSFRRESGGPATSEGDPTWFDRLMANMRDHASWLPLRALEGDAEDRDSPGLMQVLASSLHIMQDRITRSRMAGDPPDLVIAPRVDHIGLLEFDRAREAIAEGEACVHRLSSALEGIR